MTTPTYRVKAYVSADHRPPDGGPIIVSVATLAEADRLLDALVKANIVTGGHVETSIEGIGWVVYSGPL